MKARPYGEGTLFHVSTNDGGRRVPALLARQHRKTMRGEKLMAIYCFLGLPELACPLPSHVLKREQNLCFVIVSDYALKEGKWPIVGMMPDFTREAWPMLPLSRLPPGSPHGYLDYLDEDNVARLAKEVQIARADAIHYYPDILHTPNTLEWRLSRVTTGEEIRREYVDRAEADEVRARAEWPRIRAEIEQAGKKKR